MSQENVDIVRECCEAFDRGDYPAALAAFDPNVEYDLTNFPDGQIYRGPGGVREAFRIWMGTGRTSSEVYGTEGLRFES